MSITIIKEEIMANLSAKELSLINDNRKSVIPVQGKSAVVNGNPVKTA